MARAPRAQGLQDLCYSRGISMAELGRRLGLNHGIISTWRLKGCPEHRLEQVATILHCTREELITGDIQPRRGRPLRLDKQYKPRVPWTDAEREMIRELAGTMSMRAIAEAVTERYQIRRTWHGVEKVAGEMGVLLGRSPDLFSVTEFARLVGVHREFAVRHVVKPGLVQSSIWDGGRRKSAEPSMVMRVIHRSEVERFLREYPWMYDWAMVQPGPLRLLAEVVNRRDPYLSRKDAARLLGVQPSTLGYWVRRGVLSPKIRPGGGHDLHMFRAAELPEALTAIERERKTNRAICLARGRATQAQTRKAA